MSFFAILFALLIEQVRPLARDNSVHMALRAWVGTMARNFDAGRPAHGWVVWSLAVLVPTAAVLGIHWALVWSLGWAAAIVWNVVVLYATLGFRQFSHHFTSIRDALEAGDEIQARQLLAQWQRVDGSALPRSEIVRHVIEYSVLAAHRHVFGVLCWTLVLAALGLGPAGAVFYRLSEFASRYWQANNPFAQQDSSPAVRRAAASAWTLIDWVPARVTALGFAVMGSFEDAIDSWRNYAEHFPNDNDGVILAATSGALNVRLGGEALKISPRLASGGAETFEADVLQQDTEATPGREPELSHLRSVVGLVWRTVVVWMGLLALLTLARLLG
jgi:adenosylcobinamide-phosphate synthase